VRPAGDRPPPATSPTPAPTPPDDQTGEQPLPWGVRVVLFVLGWTLILVGIAGLILPGIQGIATILAGLAILSLASETAYHLLHRLLRRWPKAWEKVERFRSWCTGKIERLLRR
jgi:peptidoglycan/LPS O-acetylase OafA/YrhL